jgi:polysaccharide export outer membrane protein
MISRFRVFLLGSIAVTTSIVAGAQTVPTPDPANGKGAVPADAAVRQDDKYRIGFRDKLSVQVFRHGDLSQTVIVNPNGTINLFRLPEPIMAVCKTERELANDIAAAYRKDYLKNPEVNVIAVEQMSQSFAVMGAVEKPGNYFINRKVRLLELLAFAGGPSKEAGSSVVVVRTGATSTCDQTAIGPDQPVGLFDYRIRELQEGKVDLIMQPGDIVSMMPADIVYVYGNVNEQGQVEMKQQMTLTQAIVSAKGIRPATQKDKVRLFRQKPGTTERTETIYDLNAINKGTVPDPVLQPNDIVAVSEDKTKAVFSGIARSFLQGVGGVWYRF